MRVLVLSDIHSNLEALRAVLRDAGAVDATWCLGDLVGYGPQPNECVELLRQCEPNVLCIAGNHDCAAIDKLDISIFSADAERAVLWTREQLSASTASYLEGLPERLTWGDVTLVHGSPGEPMWEYLVSAARALENFPLLKTRYCLIGHSHVPLVFVEATQPGLPNGHVMLPGERISLGERRMFLNPGSVGQPRDGNRDASYVLLDTETGRADYCRVEYAFEKTQRLMQQSGLPDRLIVRLAYGL